MVRCLEMSMNYEPANFLETDDRWIDEILETRLSFSTQKTKRILLSCRVEVPPW